MLSKQLGLGAGFKPTSQSDPISWASYAFYHLGGSVAIVFHSILISHRTSFHHMFYQITTSIHRSPMTTLRFTAQDDTGKEDKTGRRSAVLHLRLHTKRSLIVVVLVATSLHRHNIFILTQPYHPFSLVPLALTQRPTHCWLLSPSRRNTIPQPQPQPQPQP